MRAIRYAVWVGLAALAITSFSRLAFAEVLATSTALGGDGGELVLVQAVQLEDRSGYTTEYLFGMSRAVADSTLHPALKPPVFLLTIPLDIVFLPFAAIGGFF